ncbi:MAG: response regulator [Bacteroidales bacterium]|nr:response regulator [Bacteroidales bacterium]
MENHPNYRWNKKHILVVEDDETSAYLLDEFLRETGAKIEYVTDGEGAVEYMREHPETDLILMDIHLPQKDGFTATREIKAIAQNVVIIAQTAYAFSIDHHEAELAGCDAFFTKPLNPILLLDKMNAFLS